MLPTGTRDKSRAEGVYLQGATAKVLAAPMNDGDQQVIIMRIYSPDTGTAPTAGVPLPTPVLRTADGQTLRGAQACQAIKAAQQLRISPDAVGMPAWRYRELLTLPGKPDTHPATNPPTWYAQFDRVQFESIFTGDTSKNDYSRKSQGFFPTVDNQYVRTFFNRKFGPIFVLRGKKPRTPKTMSGDAAMEMNNVDMRYWSICSQKGAASTMVTQCLNDEQIVTDKDGNYLIAVSRAADRPRTAYPECGINWLRQPDDGDGLYDADQGNLLMRNMLVTPAFKQAVQSVTKTGDESEVMGPYLPRGFYLVQATFESLFPCKSAAEQGKIATNTDEMDAAQVAARAAK